MCDHQRRKYVRVGERERGRERGWEGEGEVGGVRDKGDGVREQERKAMKCGGVCKRQSCGEGEMK